jgi:chromosome segregation ATPase
VKSAQAELAKLRPSIDAASNALKKLEGTASPKAVATTEAALKKAKDQSAKLAAAAVAANKKVPAEVAALKKSLAAQVAALDKSLVSYAKQETDAKSALQATRVQLANTQTTIGRLEVGEVFSKFYYARQDFEARKLDHLKATARLKDAQSAFQRVDSGVSGVSKALAKKEEEKRSLEAQLKKLQAQIDSVKAEADAANKAAAEVDKALKAKEKEMSTFEEELKKRKAIIGKKVATK